MTILQYCIVHLNITLQPTPESSKWSLYLRFPNQRSVCTSSPHTCYISRQSLWFEHPAHWQILVVAVGRAERSRKRGSIPSRTRFVWNITHVRKSGAMPLLSIYLRSGTHGRPRIYSYPHCPEYIHSRHAFFDLIILECQMHASDRLQ